MKLVFVQSGGTIDKDYPKTSHGYAFEFGEPATIRILAKLNPAIEYEIITPFQKDSMDITENDRKELADLIQRHDSHKFILSHGTDTLLETAAYLHESVKEKLIILTGALRPERFSNSDAPVHLGMAIGAANVLQQGVYVAMHGWVLPFREMNRNPNTGQFVKR